MQFCSANIFDALANAARIRRHDVSTRDDNRHKEIIFRSFTAALLIRSLTVIEREIECSPSCSQWRRSRIRLPAGTDITPLPTVSAGQAL
jgi:hypothetical protein